jgi:hypothetical protein
VLEAVDGQRDFQLVRLLTRPIGQTSKDYDLNRVKKLTGH